MTATPDAIAAPKRTARQRIGRAVLAAAFTALLMLMATRAFLGEMPYHRPQLRTALTAGAADRLTRPVYDRTELSRALFAGALLAVVAAWAVGSAIGGKLQVKHVWLGAVIAIFAGVSLISALQAADKGVAMLTWVEQFAILSAGWVAAQFCDDRRRFRLVVVVLAAVGIALAAKGIWQVAVEIPEVISQFEDNPAEHLRAAGFQPGTPQARAYEFRLRNITAKGFFPLANVFGSMLIILLGAGLGLAVDAIIAAASERKQSQEARARGEIHSGTLAGVLATAAAAMVAGALALTRTRAGIAAAAVSLIASAVVFALRRHLASHWKKCVIAVAVAAMIGIAVTIGWGMTKGRLPTKSLAVRWFYWTASGEIARDNPILGVGPGNFQNAYLQYRLPQAAEEVRNPHNLIANAAAEYGLAGGAFYLAAVAVVLVGLCRPRKQNAPTATFSRPAPVATAAILVAVVAAVLAGRVFLGGAGVHWSVMLIEAVGPAIVLAAAMALCWWATSGAASMPSGAMATRIMLGCGLGAFVLHNMTTLSLWTPGSAMVFWVAGGACLASGRETRERCLVAWRRPAACAAVVLATAAIACACLPVIRRTVLSERAFEALNNGQIEAGTALAKRAAEADQRNSQAAAEVATTILWSCHPGSGEAAARCLQEAHHWATVATNRSPQNSARRRLAAQIAWRQADPSVNLHQLRPDDRVVPLDSPPLKEMATAVALNPQDSRLRLAYADMLLWGRQFQQCIQQIQLAEKIDGQLRQFDPVSVDLLDVAELAKKDLLLKRAKSLRSKQTKPK